VLPEGDLQLLLREEPLLEEHLPELLRRVLGGHHRPLVVGRPIVLVTVGGLLKSRKNSLVVGPMGVFDRARTLVLGSGSDAAAIGSPLGAVTFQTGSTEEQDGGKASHRHSRHEERQSTVGAP